MTKYENYISNFTIEEFMDDRFEDEETVLTEESIFRNTKNGSINIKIHGSGITNRNFAKSPYIKIYKDNKPFCGINFSKKDNPVYEDHLHQDGRLSDDEKEELNKIMNKKCNIGKYKGNKVWDAIIKATLDYTTSEEEVEFIKSLEQPDFTLLEDK